jgi:hypothetical protein
MVLDKENPLFAFDFFDKWNFSYHAYITHNGGIVDSTFAQNEGMIQMADDIVVYSLPSNVAYLGYEEEHDLVIELLKQNTTMTLEAWLKLHLEEMCRLADLGKLDQVINSFKI